MWKPMAADSSSGYNLIIYIFIIRKIILYSYTIFWLRLISILTFPTFLFLSSFSTHINNISIRIDASADYEISQIFTN